jgi:hypothetical protein
MIKALAGLIIMISVTVFLIAIAVMIGWFLWACFATVTLIVGGTIIMIKRMFYGK